MTTAPQEPERAGGKGRPTPRRRDQQQRNYNPVVAPPRKKVEITGATKQERRAQRDAAKARGRAERLEARQRMAAGDERYLNERDRGQVRRWARDYVDARRNVAEYLLPVMLVSIVLTVAPVPALRVVSTFVLYGFVVVAAADVFLLRRRVTKLATDKFGAAKVAGVGGYAMMRALQMRRTRLPKPAVQRGKLPS